MILSQLFRKSPVENKQVSIEDKLEAMAKRHIGTKIEFTKGTIPLYSEEETRRIFREVLGIKIEGNDQYSLDFGDELILGRDIKLRNSPSFIFIAPYNTIHSFFDITLKAVEFGNLVGSEYVLPNSESGQHIIGQGFKFSPYLINRI
jgi:hypothetical protein